MHSKTSLLFGIAFAIAAPNLLGWDNANQNYVLGPDDLITISARDVPEIGIGGFRIRLSGQISLPMIGLVQAGGFSVEALEQELSKLLERYIVHPDVIVNVVEFRSQPVSVVGAVKIPSIIQIQGRKNLTEVLAAAGGLRDDAGDSLKITRQVEMGPIPLPGTIKDATGAYSVGEVKINALMDGRNPSANIPILGRDVITIPQATMIHVLGDVHRPGNFIIRDQENLSVLLAVSLAEGTLRSAAPNRARILRRSAGSIERTEIAVNISRILAGKEKDVPLEIDDILLVPNNLLKSATIRAAEAAISIGSGLAIYH